MGAVGVEDGVSVSGFGVRVSVISFRMWGAVSDRESNRVQERKETWAWVQ